MTSLRTPKSSLPPLEGTAPDDALLVSRCLNGDETAWKVLVGRYHRLVYSIALRAKLDPHAAADVFQTIFAKLVQHLPHIAEPQKLQSWIVKASKREALLQRRRAERTVSMTAFDTDESDAVLEWDIVDDAPQPDEALAELQDLVRLRLALERLDERCVRLLRELFDDEKASYIGVAQRFGIAIGSIGPTRSRCLDKLRRLID